MKGLGTGTAGGKHGAQARKQNLLVTIKLAIPQRRSFEDSW